MSSSLVPADAPLTLSQAGLRLLIKLNIAMGILILILLVAATVNGAFVMHALGVPPAQGSNRLIMAMRGIMFVGILGTPLLHVVFTRLLAIVETVKAGDPFVLENAARLHTIAWAVVGVELMHVVVVLLVNYEWVGTQKIYVGRMFSVTSWLTILLLFVLAQVFDHGARMRDDLAGTV
jgi:hypothetical protein